MPDIVGGAKGSVIDVSGGVDNTVHPCVTAMTTLVESSDSVAFTSAVTRIKDAIYSNLDKKRTLEIYDYTRSVRQFKRLANAIAREYLRVNGVWIDPQTRYELAVQFAKQYEVEKLGQ